MNTVFNSRFSTTDGQITRGGEGKRGFFSDSTFRGCELEGKVNSNCFKFLQEMRGIFQDGYYSGDKSAAGKRKRQSALKKLAQSDFLFKRYKYYLSQLGWPTNDGSIDQVMVVRKANGDTLKRKLPSVFDDDHGGNARVKRPMVHTMARISTPTDSSRSGSTEGVDDGHDGDTEMVAAKAKGKGKAKAKAKGKAKAKAKGKGKEKEKETEKEVVDDFEGL